MADVQAKRDAAIKAKEDARKKEVDEIKAAKAAKAAERKKAADDKAAADAAAQKKKEEVEAKRAKNVAAKEAGRGGKEAKSKYSKKDVFELKRVFDEYDADGSGRVSLDEFTKALRSHKEASAPRPGEKSSLEQRNAAKGISILDLSEGAFHELDKDGDGEITFAELLKLMYRFAGPEEMETMMSWVAPPPEPEPEPKAELSAEAIKSIKAIFKLYDKDKSGKLTLKELKVALEKTGLDPENDIKAFMKEFDQDENEELDIQEFIKLMESTGAFDEM